MASAAAATGSMRLKAVAEHACQGGDEMSILFLLFSLGIIWIIRSFWPVNGLAFVDLERASEETKTMKILDVRDAVDYRQSHFPGSINIWLGRLPFVWNKDLSLDEPVLILSDSRRKSMRAARILKNNGFLELYAVRKSRKVYCPLSIFQT